MLYVTFQTNAPHGQKRDEIWHIGTMKPYHEKDETVVAIQVDGDELEEIIGEFKNIIYPVSRRVVTWRGETAQFIWEHLKDY